MVPRILMAAAAIVLAASIAGCGSQSDAYKDGYNAGVDYINNPLHSGYTKDELNSLYTNTSVGGTVGNQTFAPSSSPRRRSLCTEKDPNGGTSLGAKYAGQAGGSSDWIAGCDQGIYDAAKKALGQ
jgi:hypothetical protein